MALVFFQGTLILGYWASRKLAPNPQARWIVAALAATGATVQTYPSASPNDLWAAASMLLPWAGVAVGLFCTTPLLQARQDDPADYGIYSWSNAGAFIGLASYPVLVEPNTELATQKWVIVGGALATALVGMRKKRGAPESAGHATAESKEWRAGWLVLPAVSSATSLATTNQLGQEVAAGPLTWTIPLGLFLATYVYAFGQKTPRGINRWVAIIGGAASIVAVTNVRMPGVIATLVASSIAMLACHLRLAQIKPADSARFYVLNGVGGLLGTASVAFLLPNLTDRLWEVPILFIGATAWAARQREASERAKGFATAAGIGTLAVALYLSAPDVNFETYRSCYSPYRVSDWSDRVIFECGNTIHGVESKEGHPFIHGYYHPDSGVGKAIRREQQRKPGIKVTVVGLGVGNLNRYARPTDRFEFIELDPLVEKIARERFRSLNATNKVTIGDGRRVLAREEAADNDIIVLDAFSGDAVPTHLLTEEAGRLYKARLKKNGTLVINVTNRHLNLLPITKSLADSLGATFYVFHQNRTETNSLNRWVVLDMDGQPPQGRAMWTDQKASIWPLLWQKGGKKSAPLNRHAPLQRSPSAPSKPSLDNSVTEHYRSEHEPA